MGLELQFTYSDLKRFFASFSRRILLDEAVLSGARLHPGAGGQPSQPQVRRAQEPPPAH